MRRLALAAAATLASCNSQAPAADEADTAESIARNELQADACRQVTFEGTLLTDCIADPARHSIALVLGSENGRRYRSLAGLALERSKDSASPQVAFATNGWMFDEEGGPVGYYVENGERLQKLNRNPGPGNFHLLPNGVFYGSGGKWRVRSSDWFAKNVHARPSFATQSGPMLVIDGKLHPKIAKDGQSRHIRNAVGIDGRGRAHFVISEEPLSFGRLARFYRDELKVGNALYLDGAVSALWDPKTGRIDGSPPLGPLIVVEKRAKADSARTAQTGKRQAKSGE